MAKASGSSRGVGGLFALARDRACGVKGARRKATQRLLALMGPSRRFSMSDQPQNALHNEEGSVFSLSFSPQGRFVAASDADCLSFWRMPELSESFRVTSHSELVTAVKWVHGSQDEDGAFFSSGMDANIVLHRDFKEVARYSKHRDWLRSLEVSPDNGLVLSGCVSAVVVAHDVETQDERFRISHQLRQGAMNTINALQFLPNDPNVFLCGYRDGFVRVFDVRTLRNQADAVTESTCSFFTHTRKLNSVVCSGSGDHWLSAGRDSVIRLWDRRKLSAVRSEARELSSSAIVREYSQHRCACYNMNAAFFNDDHQILTGSDTGTVFVYDVLTGGVVGKMAWPEQEQLGPVPHVHLVAATSAWPCTAVAACTSSNSLVKWSPCGQGVSLGDAGIAQLQTDATGLERKHNGSDPTTRVYGDMDVNAPRYRSLRLKATELMVRKYGDEIMELVHRNDLTFSSGLSLHALIENGSAEDSLAALSIVSRVADELAAMPLDAGDEKHDDKESKSAAPPTLPPQASTLRPSSSPCSSSSSVSSPPHGPVAAGTPSTGFDSKLDLNGRVNRFDCTVWERTRWLSRQREHAFCWAKCDKPP